MVSVSPQIRELEFDFWFFLNSCAGTFKDAATHRGGNCAADKSIPPMVVMSLWSHFPLLHSPSATFGFNAVLSGKVFCKKHMLFATPPPERKAATVAKRNENTAGNKALPVFRILDYVSYRALSANIRHSPVKTDSVAWSFLVFSHWL